MANIIRRDSSNLASALKRQLAQKSNSGNLQLAMLLLDSSGSMGGSKWTELKAAVRGFCAHKADAYISMAHFNSSLELLGTPTKDPNCNILEEIRPNGSTAMLEALQFCISQIDPSASFSKRRIVLVSDGRPDSGASPILNYLEGMEEKVVIDTVAIGNDADISLLQQIATITGGLFFMCNELSELGKIFIELSPERRMLA